MTYYTENDLRAAYYANASDGYEGVTHAGLMVVARDTGAMLLIQRAFDPEDAPEVAETWELPGGGLDESEDPWEGAVREFEEETSLGLPEGEVVHGWRGGDQDQYQGFVYAVEAQFPLTTSEFDQDEVQDITWATPEQAATLNLRPEFAQLDLNALVATVSGNEKESEMPDVPANGDALESMFEDEPMLSRFDLDPGPIPIHGVLAPEDMPSGDGRGFNPSAATTRPLRLPFRYVHHDVGAHDGAVTVGSIDRVMRHGNLIHWEGALMDIPDAENLFDLLLHFGRYGVSIDGDKGSLDNQRSDAENMTWFDSVRIAAATAVGIPAFHEAWVALGPHPDMPTEDTLVASLHESGDLIGATKWDRGPGWVTNPKETKRIHDYWTKKGQPGYAKIAWGTNGDYTRCTKLVGEKIAANSPEDLRFIKRICAQWHHDALGYWPGQANMPGNPTTEEIRRKRKGGFSVDHDLLAMKMKDLKRKGLKSTEDEDMHEVDDAVWEAVLVSSVVSGNHARPRLSYFHRPDVLDEAEGGALVIEDPDEYGFQHTYGYAGEWGVCHIGMSGQCVEPPITGSDDYPEFHLGRTRTDEGYINTGVLTYGVGHRDADTILRESPEQAYFDNVNNAWAAVRVGEDARGIWFSGVVLPGVPNDHLVKIEASGQVSGEWLYGAMRACLTVNVPGFPVQRASAEYDENGNVIALAASAFGKIDAPCTEAEPTPAERMAALRQADAEARFEALREQFNWVDVAEELVAEAQEEGRVEPVGLREDGAIVYEKDGEVPGTDTIVEPMPEEVS